MVWRRFFRRAARDRELTRELHSYIDIETDENIARGMTPADARAAAQRKLGNITRVREDVYLMNSIHPFDALWQDVRYALRLLVRDKGLAAAAVVSLALGIGANAAIFQLLDAIRLRSLPVERPHELVEARTPPGTSKTGSFKGSRPMFTSPQVEELRRHQQVFDGLAVWSTRRFNTAPGGEVRFADGMFVSGDFFPTLGIKPAVGRLLTAADDRRGCAPVAVISRSYWQRTFGGSPMVLEQTLLLDGVRFAIVGVTEGE